MSSGGHLFEWGGKERFSHAGFGILYAFKPDIALETTAFQRQVWGRILGVTVKMIER
jgi:hypothetical protein